MVTTLDKLKAEAFQLETFENGMKCMKAENMKTQYFSWEKGKWTENEKIEEKK